SGGLRVHPFANGFFFEGMTGSYVKKYQSKYEDSEPVKWEPTEFTYSIECGYALPIFPSIILTPSFSYVNQAPGFLSFGPRDYLYDRGVRLDLGLSAYLGRRG
ncbi:MAG: hypothetical protein HKO93_02970, partial [Flavobacteriales bacterium]|nr:hypothetical protein [Flavobacteriales bacterium]